jgi:hypothetical protein
VPCRCREISPNARLEQAEILTHAEFADLFIERITQFARERPAYLSLLAAPIRFRRDLAARKASRIAIANAFQAKNPSLLREQSLRTANVSLQIVRGMMNTAVSLEPRQFGMWSRSGNSLSQQDCKGGKASCGNH